jgi:hypothetical protein
VTPGYYGGYPPPQPAAAQRLPRRGLAGFTAGFIVAMGFAFFVPIVLLAARGAPAGWRIFKDGGAPMYGVLLLSVMIGIGVTVAGCFLVRGARVPGGMLFACALLPFAVGVLGATWQLSRCVGALSGESVDASQKARIMAEGISELTSDLMYGAAVSSALSWGLFVLSAFAVLAVDTKSLTRVPAGAAPWVSLGAAVTAFVVCGAARGALRVEFTSYDVFALGGVLCAGLAAACAPGVRTLASSDEKDEASWAWRALLLAAVALTVSVFLMDRAATAQSVRDPLGAISGESVDNAQRARILAMMIAPLKYRPVVTVVDVLGCALPFVPALVAGWRAPQKVSVWGFLGAAAGTAVLGLMALYGVKEKRGVEVVHRPYAAIETIAGVDLPVAPDAARGFEADVGPTPVVVGPDGAIVSGKAGASDATVALGADRRLTVDAFAQATVPGLLAGSSSRRVAFVAKPATPIDTTDLGMYAPLVGTNVLLFAATLSPRATAAESLRERSTWDGDDEGGYGARPDVSAIAVVEDGDTARMVRVTTTDPPASLGDVVSGVPFALGYSFDEERAAAVKKLLGPTSHARIVLFAPSPSDDIARLVTRLDALRIESGGWGSSRYATIVLTGDRAGVERLMSPRETVAASGSTSGTTPIVNGRLPPEVIQRIVRQHTAEMKLCYQNALRTHPSLHGRVVTKFVIDRTGSVTVLADAGSDLGDAATVACVQRVFSRLTFPAPDGGMVTVVYPIVFAAQ